MKTLSPAMLHKVTALQSVKFRTMVTRDVETRVADRTLKIPHTQDEWVFLKKDETYLSASPIIAIHPDYMPQERSTRNAGVPMIMIPAAPRPLEFCDLLRLELVPAPSPEPPASNAWA